MFGFLDEYREIVNGACPTAPEEFPYIHRAVFDVFAFFSSPRHRVSYVLSKSGRRVTSLRHVNTKHKHNVFAFCGRACRIHLNVKH